MTSPATPITQFMLKLRKQLDNLLKGFDGKPASAVKLKAQVIITCEQFATLSSDNKSLLVALALRPTDRISPLTHHSFCCAVILSKFSQQFHYHSHYSAELISAALTMRLGLDLQGQQLSNVVYQRQKLTQNQQKYYKDYPLHSAKYLHKARVISKNSVYATLQHQELLDGSGYPKQLKSHQISHSGQLLSLVNKFVELVTPRHQRAPFSISQSLSYLARRPHLYNERLLKQLTLCLTQSKLGMSVSLPRKSIGLIKSVNALDSSMMLDCFEDVDGSLKAGEQTKKQLFDNSFIPKIAPKGISESKMFTLLEEHKLVRITDICHSIGRLKPTPTLAVLLDSLASLSPEQEVIAHQIGALPSLGEDLITSLMAQYPNRKFNSSFHALQMVGFSQSRPLLSILALRHQLAYYYFPALSALDMKVDTLLATARHISEYTPKVMPNQLAMFVLVNVSPLYFDQRVHGTTLPMKVDLNHVNPLQAAALMGLTASPKQAQIINTLGRLWENNRNTKQLILLENDLTKTENRFHHELVLGYQLALILTQHIYNNLSFEHHKVQAHLKVICRKLKISSKALEALCQQTLSTAPSSPLG